MPIKSDFCMKPNVDSIGIITFEEKYAGSLFSAALMLLMVNLWKDILDDQSNYASRYNLLTPHRIIASCMPNDPIFQCIPVSTSTRLAVPGKEGIFGDIEWRIISSAHNSLSKRIIAMIEVSKSMGSVLNSVTIYKA